jgi:hypothetical protein
MALIVQKRQVITFKGDSTISFFAILEKTPALHVNGTRTTLILPMIYTDEFRVHPRSIPPNPRAIPFSNYNISLIISEVKKHRILQSIKK